MTNLIYDIEKQILKMLIESSKTDQNHQGEDTYIRYGVHDCVIKR